MHVVGAGPNFMKATLVLAAAATYPERWCPWVVWK
jgi:hypothetical protein